MIRHEVHSRVFDRINRQSEYFVNPDLVVMNIDSASELIDELRIEFDEDTINLENASKFLGLDIVILDGLRDEFKLASYLTANL